MNRYFSEIVLYFTCVKMGLHLNKQSVYFPWILLLFTNNCVYKSEYMLYTILISLSLLNKITSEKV